VSASAQAGFALKGTVVDTTRAPIVGARVSIDADAKAPSETLVSDHSGVFAVTFRPGRHHVTISSEGFEPLTVTVDAPATGGESPALTLQIAGFRYTVNVAAPPTFHAAVVMIAEKTPDALRGLVLSVIVSPS